METCGRNFKEFGETPLERTWWKVKGRLELSRPSEQGPIGFSVCVCLFLLPIEGDVRVDGCHSVCGPLRTGPGGNSTSTPPEDGWKMDQRIVYLYLCIEVAVLRCYQLSIISSNSHYSCTS